MKTSIVYNTIVHRYFHWWVHATYVCSCVCVSIHFTNTCMFPNHHHINVVEFVYKIQWQTLCIHESQKKCKAINCAGQQVKNDKRKQILLSHIFSMFLFFSLLMEIRVWEHQLHCAVAASVILSFKTVSFELRTEEEKNVKLKRQNIFYLGGVSAILVLSSLTIVHCLRIRSTEMATNSPIILQPTTAHTASVSFSAN